MKVSISNIAWDYNDDISMYEIIKKYELQGIEIAPGRLIKSNPYDKINSAWNKMNQVYDKFGFEVSSMQSILFGFKINMFETKDNLNATVNLLTKAIDFAAALRCKNIVFGSPKNRVIKSEDDYNEALNVFKKLGDYAFSKNTIFSIEPNPKIYGTNFINTTEEAIKFIKKVNSSGFKLNLDLGTILANDEDMGLVSNNIKLINHVHISEPFLKPILPRKEHRELYNILKCSGYEKYVSIEMKNCNNIAIVNKTIAYVLSVFR